jgi:hypothetical protein
MDKSLAVGNVGNVGKSPNLGGSSPSKAIGETCLFGLTIADIRKHLENMGINPAGLGSWTRRRNG